MRRAKVSFTANFFGCAGYEIIDNAGFKIVEDGVIAALKSNAEIIVFCSSDKEYAANVPEACKQLKAQNPEISVVVAGNPTEIIEELKQAGVDDFIHIRSNVVSTLWKYQYRFGII